MTASLSTRLHITPLDAGLLPIVLGAHLAKIAKNISLQSVETFPENNYGFVDLPENDAKNLIARLNGAILKGRKMKVEKARSKKRSQDVVEEDNAPEPDRPQKRAKKSVRDIRTADFEGYQISNDRKVKRGWTEARPEERTRPKSKDKTKKVKRQTPSQYTESEELLFRTKLPPNKERLDQNAKSKGKEKQKRTTGTLVHEFQRTEIQPAFVRDTTSSGQAAEYVDNVGWVDDTGDVIEKVPSSSSLRTTNTADGQRIGTREPDGAKMLDRQAQSLDPSSSDDVSDSATRDENVGTELKRDPTSDSDTSSSTSEADSNSSSDEERQAGGDAASATQDDKHVSPETPQKAHPLEALFKRPKPPTSQEAAKPSLEIETSFSFFDQSAADADDELPAMPATPFTSNDMGSRGIRSAAPTPDTAHPSRFAGFANLLAAGPPKDQSKKGKTLETMGNDATTSTSEQSGERAQSDFEKRFWAERGQNNRAWKTRRKTALKEQRQQENRLRRPRNW